MRTLKLLLLLVVVCSFSATASAQQVGDDIVVTAENAQLRSGNDTTGSIEKGNILSVKKVNGDWFWVIYSSRNETVKGWINRADVIPVSQALDFFNDEVRQSPTAWAYNVRGSIWNHKGEHEIAISDFNESIRLDPKFAPAYIIVATQGRRRRNTTKRSSITTRRFGSIQKTTLLGTIWRWCLQRRLTQSTATANEPSRQPQKPANLQDGRMETRSTLSQPPTPNQVTSMPPSNGRRKPATWHLSTKRPTTNPDSISTKPTSRTVTK
jgi:tetratricopeptide (TPR) repeat protein